MDIWDKLYDAARKVQNERTVSPFVDAGAVAAGILTKAGNVYVGVCIGTACSLGMRAERNAIANMITCGESQIDKLVAVMPDEIKWECPAAPAGRADDAAGSGKRRN